MGGLVAREPDTKADAAIQLDVSAPTASLAAGETRAARRSSPRPFCTASLIGEASILTAKHCRQAADRRVAEGLEVTFTIGADARRPRRAIPVVAWESAPVDEGGFAGLGSDVGVGHLAEKVMGVRPLAIAKLAPRDVNTRFAKIGYGVQNDRRTYGTRKVGSETLRALSGNLFEIDFGSRDGFFTWAEAHVGQLGGREGRSEQAWSTYLRAVYDQGTILDDYEAVAGGLAGDSQACNGDSGGPLARWNGRTHAIEIYGVESAGLHVDEVLCDFGGIDAVFGPETYRFLEQARDWTGGR